MNAVIIRNDADLTVRYTEAALAMRDKALAVAALIGRVASPSQQEAAVLAHREIAAALKTAEDARRSAKAPVINFGRRIDAVAREFCVDLDMEARRLSSLVGDYQSLEQARVRAAQQAENERLSALERERAAALAQATTHEQMEAVTAEFSARAADEAPPVEAITPARAEGQRITEDWDITVVDVWLLARAHPGCVRIEPRLAEIKGLLTAGVKVAGVRAERIINAGVRVKPAVTAIDV